MSNGIILLSNKTLDLLKQKHSKPKESSPETILQSLFRPIQPVGYDGINDALVMRLSMLTKCGSGPLALDNDCCRRILTIKQFGNSSSDLRKAFVNLFKKLCSEELQFT